MRLPDILRACTRSHLAAVAAALGWPDRAGAAKSTLVAELLVHLDGDAHLRAQFAAIEDEGLAALRVLLRYGGSMRQPAFEARFGPLRPYRPWSADSVRRPWRAPVSLTERVVYAGLVFPIGHGNSPHARQLVLPVEYGRCLPSVSARDRGIGRAMDHRAPRPARAPSAPVEPLADLALFLAYLNRHAIVPLHGRWLAPTHVRRLGGRLRPREPVCTAASELQAERLRFVHFVAERLGLVSVDGDHLRPSPLAVAWLSAPPPDALSEIRWAWLEAYLPHPDRDSRSAAISLAQRYRLPGAAPRRSRAAVRALLRHLVELAPLPPGASLQPLAELARHVPPATVPCDGDPPGEETHIAWLDEVLRVELAGLGLLRQLSPSEPGRDACLALDSEDAKWLATHAAPIGLQPTVASEGPAPAFHAVRTIGSTPHAPPGTASPDRPTAHAHSTPSPNAGPIPSPCLPSPHLPIPCIADQNFAWHAPTALAGIVALAPWASWKERPGDDAARLHLTCASVQSALVARPRAPALAAGELTLLLRRHLAPPPPAAMLTLVHEWLQAAPLEHGPHASWPASSAPPARAFALAPTEHLAVAVAVYEGLAPLAGLIPPPVLAATGVADALPPSARERAEATAAAFLSRLQLLIDGAAPAAHGRGAPIPRAGLVPLDALAARIERAIAHGDSLHLRYWTASRHEETERVVRPEMLEWIGDHGYLTAWCELRRDERVFRLDRIRALTRCERARAG